MSAVDEITDALIAAGLTPGQAAALLGRAIAEITTPTRSKGAIRTARWREKQASQSVTERHTVTPGELPFEASPTVTDRHKASQRDGAHTSKKEKVSRPASQASRLPDDWKATEKDVAYAISKGLHPSRIDTVSEKFKNHWLSKSGRGATSPNWHLRWCTWVMNEIEWNAQKGARANGRGGMEGII